MVEICIEALCSIFLTNENKFEYSGQKWEKNKLKFLFKLFKFQYKWFRVNQIGSMTVFVCLC